MTFSQAMDNLYSIASELIGTDKTDMMSALNIVADPSSNDSQKNAAILILIDIYDRNVSQNFYDNLDFVCLTVNPNGPRPTRPH